jgi:hypothetical protein
VIPIKLITMLADSDITKSECLSGDRKPDRTMIERLRLGLPMEPEVKAIPEGLNDSLRLYQGSIWMKIAFQSFYDGIIPIMKPGARGSQPCDWQR